MRLTSSFRQAIVGCAIALGVAIPQLAMSQQFAGQQFAGRYPHIAPSAAAAPTAGPGYYAAAMQGTGAPPTPQVAPTSFAAPPSMPRTYPGMNAPQQAQTAAPMYQASGLVRQPTQPTPPPASSSPLAGIKTSLGRFANPATPEIPPPQQQPTLHPRQAAWAGGAPASPNSAPPVGSFPTQPAAYNAPVSPYADYAAEVAARAGVKPVAYNAPATVAAGQYRPAAYGTAPAGPAFPAGARLTAPTVSPGAGYGAAYLQANSQPMMPPSVSAEAVPTYPVPGASGYPTPAPGAAGSYGAPPLGGGFGGPGNTVPPPNYGPVAPAGPHSSIWQQPAMPDPISSGGYGNYADPNYGAMPGGSCEPDLSYFPPVAPSCGPWFASVSGLIMTRDVPNNVPLAYLGADPHGQSLINSEQAGFDWSGGAEAKLGRMISDRWAMEVVYWWLDPSNAYISQRSLANDINSRLDMSDVIYDGFPLSNIYENSREQRVYRMNQFQNIEINLLQQALVVDPQSRWGMAYFMGARYFKYREILEYYAVQANSEFSDNDMTTQSGYHVRMRNSLIGGQVGARGHLYLTERLRLFATPRAGIFANAISMDQDLCMVIRLNSTKTDVTLLGQIDVGASYQIFRCCSIFGSYRAMGIAGVANADDQIPRTFDSLPDLAQINSSGSIILHGWNMGVQFQF
jgi:hypothetical protein